METVQVVEEQALLTVRQRLTAVAVGAPESHERVRVHAFQDPGLPPGLLQPGTAREDVVAEQDDPPRRLLGAQRLNGLAQDLWACVQVRTVPPADRLAPGVADPEEGVLVGLAVGGA